MSIPIFALLHNPKNNRTFAAQIQLPLDDERKGSWVIPFIRKLNYQSPVAIVVDAAGDVSFISTPRHKHGNTVGTWFYTSTMLSKMGGESRGSATRGSELAACSV